MERQIITKDIIVKMVMLWNCGTLANEISKETGVKVSSIYQILHRLRKLGYNIAKRSGGRPRTTTLEGTELSGLKLSTCG